MNLSLTTIALKIDPPVLTYVGWTGPKILIKTLVF